MSKPTVLLLSFIYLFINSLNAQVSDDLIGVWITTDHKSKVEILKNEGDNTFYGKIIWLKNPEENGAPIKDLNGNFVMGLEILKDFRFDSDEWEGGTIYDPESGNTYYCTLELNSKNKLKVRGSVDPMGWIGRTAYWHREDKK